MTLFIFVFFLIIFDFEMSFLVCRWCRRLSAHPLLSYEIFLRTCSQFQLLDFSRSFVYLRQAHMWCVSCSCCWNAKWVLVYIRFSYLYLFVHLHHVIMSQNKSQFSCVFVNQPHQDFGWLGGLNLAVHLHCQRWRNFLEFKWAETIGDGHTYENMKLHGIWTTRGWHISFFFHFYKFWVERG